MKTIEQYIDAEMSGKITRKKNSPLPNMLVLAVGIVVLALLRTVKMGDTMMTTCLTIGIILTGIGLVLTAMSLSGAMSHFVYMPTHSRMHEKKVYVSGDDFKDVVDAIANDGLQPLAAIRPVVSSNSALRIFVSSDGACALVQAIRDQVGHFDPESDVLVLTGSETSAVMSLVK